MATTKHFRIYNIYNVSIYNNTYAAVKFQWQKLTLFMMILNISKRPSDVTNMWTLFYCLLNTLPTDSTFYSTGAFQDLPKLLPPAVSQFAHCTTSVKNGRSKGLIEKVGLEKGLKPSRLPGKRKKKKSVSLYYHAYT